MKKYKAWCRWCGYRIIWKATTRVWEHVRKAPTLLPRYVCPLSPGTWHDPDSDRS